MLLLFLACSVAAQSSSQKRASQSSQKRPSTSAEIQTAKSELSRLRDEYIQATKDVKASLLKLVTIYEDNVKTGEEKVATAKRLYQEGLLDATQVEENERLLALERTKIEETRRQIENVDQQIKAVSEEQISDEQLEKELRRAKIARRRNSEPNCNNWTMTASRRQTGRTTVLAFKIICRD